MNITVHNVTGNYYDGQGPISNGSISVLASGGTAPYLFSLAGNLAINNGYFFPLNSGSYQVHVTDAKGQVADTTVIISSIDTEPSISFSNVIVPTSCTSADGSVTLVGSGGTPPYTYSIDGGVTFSSNATFTGLTQGWYTGCLVKDAKGFLAVLFQFYEDASSNYFPFLHCNNACCYIQALPYKQRSSCSSNTGIIHLLGYADGGPYAYSTDGIHFFKGNSSIGQTSVDGFDFDSLAPGLHHLYLRDTITGYTAVEAGVVAKFCYIDVTYVSVSASCHQNDGVVTVTVSNGTPPYTYTMDGVHYQTSNVFTGIAAGTYSLGVKGADGAASATTATVYNKCPLIYAIETDETCGQHNGVINAVGIQGTKPYLFSKDGIHFQTDSIFKGLEAGNYTVILEDAKGFEDSTKITISNNCLKVATTYTNATCGKKNGIITASGSGGTQPYLFTMDGINYQSNNSFTNLDTGKYTVSIKDATGLINIIKNTILNIAGPAISVATTTASCDGSGGGLTITNKGGTSPFQYSVDGINYQSNNVFTNDTAGTYVAWIKDAHSCIATDTIQIAKYPTPEVYLGNDTTLCAGQILTLKAPTATGYEYQWQDNSTGGNYNLTTAGAYWLEVTNQYHCFASDTININFKP